MISIKDDRISFDNGKWVATCICGKTNLYAQKNGALKMLNNKSCRYCVKDYRSTEDHVFKIYKREDEKWCKKCSGCNEEQAYTRKDHAKQSQLRDWQCKKCVAKSKGFSNNQPVGDKQRIYNKFSKSAKSRNISWNLTLEEMFSKYEGKCALTGWDIDIKYYNETASLDRIDSSKGYELNNIQWVHNMVNMSKNKYTQEAFINMCLCISNKINSENQHIIK